MIQISKSIWIAPRFIAGVSVEDIDEGGGFVRITMSDGRAYLCPLKADRLGGLDGVEDLGYASVTDFAEAVLVAIAKDIEALPRPTR